MRTSRNESCNHFHDAKTLGSRLRFWSLERGVPRAGRSLTIGVLSTVAVFFLGDIMAASMAFASQVEARSSESISFQPYRMPAVRKGTDGVYFGVVATLRKSQLVLDREELEQHFPNCDKPADELIIYSPKLFRFRIDGHPEVDATCFMTRDSTEKPASAAEVSALLKRERGEDHELVRFAVGCFVEGSANRRITHVTFRGREYAVSTTPIDASNLPVDCEAIRMIATFSRLPDFNFALPKISVPPPKINLPPINLPSPVIPRPNTRIQRPKHPAVREKPGNERRQIARSDGRNDALKFEFRNWTDNTGKYSVRARLVQAGMKSVVLAREDGSSFTVPLQRLGTGDRQYLTSMARKKRQ